MWTLTIRDRGHMNRIIWVQSEEKSQHYKWPRDLKKSYASCLYLPIALVLAEMNNALTYRSKKICDESIW